MALTSHRIVPPAAAACIALAAAVSLALPAVAGAAQLSAPASPRLAGDGLAGDAAGVPKPRDGVLEFPSEPAAFSWARVGGARDYQLQISETPTFSAIVFTGAGTSNAVAPEVEGGLAAGSASQPKTYYWRVRARGGTEAAPEAGAWTATQRFDRIWDAKPLNLRNGDQTLQPSAADGKKFLFGPTFSWSPVPGAAVYQVQVARSPEFADASTLYSDDGISGPSFSLPDTFLDAREYSWRVRAIDAKGRRGEWSDVGRFQKAYDLAPQNVRFDPQRGLASWNPVANASAYLVTVRGDTADGPATIVAKTRTNSFAPGACDIPVGSDACANLSKPYVDAVPGPGSTLLVAPYGLPDGNYSLQVTPIDETYGESPYGGILGADSAPVGFAVGPRPSVPTLAPATFRAVPQAGDSGGAAQDTTLTPGFSWAPVAGVSSYRFEIAFDPNFRSVIAGGVTKESAFTPRVESTLGGTLADVDGVDGRYYWRVTASNGQQAVGQFRKADPVRNVRAVPLGQTNTGGEYRYPPQVGWDPVDGAAKYEVDVSRSPRFDTTDVPTITTESLHTGFRDRLPDGSYYYRVRAIDGAGKKLAYSTSRLANPQTAVAVDPPSFVKRLDAPGLRTFGSANGGQTTASPLLLWNAVDNADGYRVEIDTSPEFASPETFDTVDNAFVPADSSLKPDTQYYWRVASTQAAKAGATSATGQFFLASGPVIGFRTSAARLALKRVATLTGTLVVNSAARRGETLLLQRSIDGGAKYRSIAKLKTGAGGLFSRQVKVLRSVRYRVRWAGEGIFGAALSGPVLVDATPRLSLRRSALRVLATRPVLLRGTLQSGLAKERLQLQYLSRGRYRPLAELRLAKGGAFRFVWKPRIAGAYRVRAVVPQTNRHANVASGLVGVRVDTLYVIRSRGPV